MIVVRCKNCNRELSSQSGKTQCCGCSNMMTLVDDVIKDSLTSEDLAWQEARKQRKVRKLDFDIR